MLYPTFFNISDTAVDNGRGEWVGSDIPCGNHRLWDIDRSSRVNAIHFYSCSIYMQVGLGGFNLMFLN